MSSDPQLNDLLKWGIENSTPSGNPSDPSSQNLRSHAPNPEALAALLGAPSHADLMKLSMAALQDPELAISEKLIAFDNLEQMIENIDNANNLDPLGLWPPLLELLAHEDADMRRMAAWCIGTAVQNNPKAQTKALELGAIGGLVAIVTKEKGDQGNDALRKKATYAISSEVRNFQPGLDALLTELGEAEKMNSGDMDRIDALMTRLRQA